MIRRFHRVQWTPQMDADLRHMWRIEGLPVPKIALRLEVSPDAVNNRASHLMLCLHPRWWMRSDNLRMPRAVWGGRDFDFWRQSDIEVSRA